MEVISIPYAVFVTACLILYYSVFKNHKKLFLTIVSLSVLGYINWFSFVLLLGSSSLTYLLAKNHKNKALLGIFSHVLVFFIAKWNMDFLIEGSVNKIIGWLGLSYYSLQNIGVLIQNYFQKSQQFSFTKLLFWNAYFPKFLSGPILMPNEMKMDWGNIKLKKENLNSGLQRITLGLFKKLVLAAQLGIIVGVIFDTPTTVNNGFTFCFGAFIFTVFMYLDFSAYTDIAIGISRLFGIDLKENFNLPFRSKSVTEYWRKTHISLIHWLTQSIYMPMVFLLRKHKKLSVVLAISATFVISGVWHGLKLGYLIWGALNALYLIIEFLRKDAKFKVHKYGIVAIPLTLLLIAFTNLFFKANTYNEFAFILNQIIALEFWPEEWMKDFVAIIGKGGYLQQQFNLSVLALLSLGFFLFEKKLESLAISSNFSVIYFLSLTTLILLFGTFSDSSGFVYMQF